MGDSHLSLIYMYQTSLNWTEQHLATRKIPETIPKSGS